MLQRIYQNHVLANLAFVLVLVIGSIAYTLLPRQQDPTINFNWIRIMTFFPGASAEDIEKRITDPLEDAIRKVQDIRFVNSSSRANVSIILVRFNEISERQFDKRLADLRREIQNKERELPAEVESPDVMEVTTANGFPSAFIAVSGAAFDENLQRQSLRIQKDLERLTGVDEAQPFGLRDPELQINILPERLQALGITAVTVADSVRANFQDVAAGQVAVDQEQWLIRLLGTNADPAYLAELPVLTPQGEIKLGSIAEVVSGREKADTLISYNGNPAIMLAINKVEQANILELIDRLQAYIDERNALQAATGVKLHLLDDQTETTRKALSIMQSNAIFGLGLVLFVTWLFLGLRIALLTSIGIPFILCGTFWVLYAMGQTLNIVVLLGIVISLGMLVDDSVVMVEAIYYRIQRGAKTLDAAVDSLREVFAPITASVLTTVAAFLPLMLLPGILGKFMFLVPFVVTVALVISLIECYWMLPVHISATKIEFNQDSKIQQMRERFLHWLRLRYTQWLVKAMRYPKRVLAIVVLLMILIFAALASDWIKKDFFASDALRLFYVSIQQPQGTLLEDTLELSSQLEAYVREQIPENELRSAASLAGLLFTETEPFIGDRYGQVIVSLKPDRGDSRPVEEIVAALRPGVEQIVGTRGEVSFLILSGGPPTTKPISIKVRGNDFADIRQGAAELAQIMRNTPGVRDVSIDDSPGQRELVLKLNQDALRTAGLQPQTIIRLVKLSIDGELAASMQYQGDELDVRVRVRPQTFQAVDDLLREPVALTDGSSVPLGALVDIERNYGIERIRHYNFLRSIEISADIDKALTDAVKANAVILAEWEKVAVKHPNVGLDSSGLLDDIGDSLAAMQQLFLMGLLLIYLILGTQFKSYFQPFLVMATIPLAFAGVILGLIINGDAVSLYTLYGVVALAGIAVNSAIVMISAANDRLQQGMSVKHAIIYAARRRLVPILITSMTTIAGLMSLAVGMGGYSLLWGPMASSIVWGLGFSTVLTLFVIPLLYLMFMRKKNKE